MLDDVPPAVAGKTLRLATWNMNHWQTPTERRVEGWDWLQADSALDVALLQEAVPPASADRNRVVYHEIAGRRPWGSAVVALADGITVEEIWSVAGGFRYRHRLASTYPGSVAVARVTIAGIAPITAVSVYNLLDGHPVANLLRVAADLVPLLDSVDGERVVVGGDFNVYGAVAPGGRTRTGALFDLFDKLGLHRVGGLAGVDQPSAAPDCPCGSGGACGHVATWKGFDLDHLFVSNALKDQVRSLAVESAVVARGLSDHAALIAGLELSAVPVSRAWDAETFVAEIGARQGEEAAGVVARLIDWAERKEDALRAANLPDCRLTDWDIPRAIAPTMYVGLSLSYRRQRPQWLFAIHAASAALDISFQYMSHPPFDTEAGREPLRLLLNQITGVTIPASRLGGRPRIPLARLVDPESLARLLGVLDRVVDETVLQPADPPSDGHCALTTCEGTVGPGLEGAAAGGSPASEQPRGSTGTL